MKSNIARRKSNSPRTRRQKTISFQCDGNEDSYGVSDVTRLLDSVERGDPKAADELLPLGYQELRTLAAQKMYNESAGHTFQPTALVHEHGSNSRGMM